MAEREPNVEPVKRITRLAVSSARDLKAMRKELDALTTRVQQYESNGNTPPVPPGGTFLMPPTIKLFRPTAEVSEGQTARLQTLDASGAPTDDARDAEDYTVRPLPAGLVYAQREGFSTDDQSVRYFLIGGAAGQQFRIVSQGNDHLSVHSFDGTTEGADAILIAKPPSLRRTGIDGTTNSAGWLFTYSDGHTRVASKSGASSVSQAIDDPYTAGTLIYATQPAGGTGVTVAGTPVVWQDLNVDARRWVRTCT